MNAAATIRQPWEDAGLTQDEFMAEAFEQEKLGWRLVVQTFVNAYPDVWDESGWWVDWTDYADWRTGELVLRVSEEEPALPGMLDRLLVIETRLGE